MPGKWSTGTLVVRVTRFGSAEPVHAPQITLSPLGAPPPPPAPFGYSSDITGVKTFQGLAPGSYVVRVRQIGFWGRTDTVIVRSGKADTVHVALDDFFRAIGTCTIAVREASAAAASPHA